MQFPPAIRKDIINTNTVEIRTIKKEDFFSVNRHRRRPDNKKFSSPCQFAQTATPFSGSTEKEQENDLGSPRKISIFTQQDQAKSLESTFGTERVLAFKQRQPRKKRPRGSRREYTEVEFPQSQERIQIDKWVKEKKARKKLSIDSFQIIHKLGDGTYSEVFLAVQKTTGFVCALKILEKERMRYMGVQQNVVRELKIQSLLHSQHICRLYGWFHDENYLYFITELSTGKNLYEAMVDDKRRRIRRTLEEVSKLIRQVCLAIKDLHDIDVIHRDIKPENILLSMGPTVKLCDFGWSVYNCDKNLRTTMCGTPLYLAPEIISCDEYNESIDVWAMGVLTFQMLTGELPFRIRSLKQLNKVINEDIEMSRVQDISAKDFITKALQKDKFKRATISELIDHPFLTVDFSHTK